MNVCERMKRCLIIEQMEKMPELSKRLGLENKSTFHSNYVNDVQKERGMKYETIKKELF